MSTQSPEHAAAGLSAEQVEDFLRRHPQFLAERPALLAELDVPHPTDGAVSLIERQIGVLREQNRQYRRKLLELVEIGRSNDALLTNLHRLTLALMRCSTLEETIAVLHDHLGSEFGADAVGLRLAGLDPERGVPRTRHLDPDDPALAAFERFFQQVRPLCGQLSPEQLDYLFGELADGIRSAALIPLGETAEYGLLAVGNSDPDYYHPAMDTELLAKLSELVSCALQPHLPGKGS
ncbi:DUF484 family protein [Thiohalobacter sp. IOR34]|uniref:DUF484 family protein n=1 Tax=Thiohalobacter sp. IOR34 TaxID=3057176 RepID=UPI0025B00C13|nr:DUF484 family protein [Thiohalobacter sp. IOR34]WJW75578.1 DUF484 family protein [Thiohalobacter sp. IOR34]